MITERETERQRRPVPLVWLRRIIVVASIVVTGWLLFGGKSAQAATTEALDAHPPLGAAGDIRAGTPSAAGIVEPAAGRITDAVGEQGRRRAQPPGRDSGDGSDSTASTGWDQSGRVEGVDIAVRAVETLRAVVAAAQPGLGPVNAMTPATAGQPGVAGHDREAPAAGVGAATGGALAHGPAASAAPSRLVRSARSSPESPPAPSAAGGHLFAESPAGTARGPVPSEPGPSIPGPFPDGLHGTASGGSAHESLDRGQTLSTDGSPLVVAPQFLSRVGATGRSTGQPQRAVIPSASPD